MNIDKFLKGEGIKISLPPPKTRQELSKIAIDEKKKINVNDITKFSKTLSNWKSTDKYRLFNMVNDTYIDITDSILADDIVIESINHYNKTGDIKYKIID